VNDKDMGQDEFDTKVSGYFSTVKRFYTATSTYSKGSWIRIPQTNVIPYNSVGDISPLVELRKTVFFEYRK